MKKIVFVALFLIVCITLSSQQTGANNNSIKRKDRKHLAKNQINQLHQGVLLVRLKTNHNTIAALQKAGQYERAVEFEKERHDKNLEIVKGFRNNYTFCPTYFFYSHYSKYVKKNLFDSVVFLNDYLVPDTNIKINNKLFFIAEFDIIEQDSTKYFDSYYYVNGENGLEKRTRYHGGSNMGFEALIIKTPNFSQLKKPFPFYVRTFGSLLISRKPKKVVRKMNIKLHNFYKKNKNI